MTYEVIDNFLPEYQHKKIQEELYGLHATFPWYYTADSLSFEDSYSQFTHIFFRSTHPNYMSSDWFYIVEPIVNLIKPDVLIRVKGNSTAPVQSEKDRLAPFHVDYDKSIGMVGVYYVNSNNGATVLESGEEIESVENRFVKFGSNVKHAVKRHIGVKNRFVINVNWIE